MSKEKQIKQLYKAYKKIKQLSLLSEEQILRVRTYLNLGREKELGDKKVKEVSKRAVNVCMFVFGAQTEEQLVSMSDLNEGYHKVRHYIILPEDSFWQRSLPCDPAEPACEEF